MLSLRSLFDDEVRSDDLIRELLVTAENGKGLAPWPAWVEISKKTGRLLTCFSKKPEKSRALGQALDNAADSMKRTCGHFVAGRFLLTVSRSLDDFLHHPDLDDVRERINTKFIENFDNNIAEAEEIFEKPNRISYWLQEFSHPSNFSLLDRSPVRESKRHTVDDLICQALLKILPEMDTRASLKNRAVNFIGTRAANPAHIDAALLNITSSLRQIGKYSDPFDRSRIATFIRAARAAPNEPNQKRNLLHKGGSLLLAPRLMSGLPGPQA